MKLNELGSSVHRIVSNQEMDLERRVLSAQLIVVIEGKDGQKIIHDWDYTAKEK